MQDADSSVGITDLLNPSDEFYTKLEDIESELAFYDRSIFKDAVIYCPFDCFNSDDLPLNSNYILYFRELAPILQFKSLIATSLGVHGNYYRLDRCTREGTDIVAEVVNGSEIFLHKTDGSIEPKGDKNGLYYYRQTLRTCPSKDGELSGSYNSDFCIDLLKACDIVVTTPASSCVSKFVKLLSTYNKKFILCVSQFCIANNTFFEMFKTGNLFLGQSKRSTGIDFIISSHYKRSNSKESQKILDDGQKAISLAYYRFFTNINFRPSYETLDLLTREENERKGVVYQEYDNFPGLNVDVTKTIPSDYSGIIGVPLTFIDYYNPNQFDIVGLTTGSYLKDLRTKTYDSPGLNNSAVVKTEDGGLKTIAKRILVRLKGVSSAVASENLDIADWSEDDWGEDTPDVTSKAEMLSKRDSNITSETVEVSEEGITVIQEAMFQERGTLPNEVQSPQHDSILPRDNIVDWWNSLEHEEQYQIWGALTERERQKVYLLVMQSLDSGDGLPLAQYEELEIFFAELNASVEDDSDLVGGITTTVDIDKTPCEMSIPEPNNDFFNEQCEFTVPVANSDAIPDVNTLPDTELKATLSGIENLVTEMLDGQTRYSDILYQVLKLCTAFNLDVLVSSPTQSDSSYEAVVSAVEQLAPEMVAAIQTLLRCQKQEYNSRPRLVYDSTKSINDKMECNLNLFTNLCELLKNMQTFLTVKLTDLEDRIANIEKSTEAILSMSTTLDQINAKLESLSEPKKKFLW